MDTYYNFPWTAEIGTYRGGEKRISIASANNGFIADIFRQSAHSNEDDWKTIASLMTIAPELLAITNAVAEGKITDEIQQSAKDLVGLIDVKDSEGFDFWLQINKLLED